MRRSKLRIYYDILMAIKIESQKNEIKPTRVQHLCKMSYDKMVRYLHELKLRRMINYDPLSLDEKGEKFLQDFEKIKDFLEEMKVEYLEEKKIES